MSHYRNKQGNRGKSINLLEMTAGQQVNAIKKSLSNNNYAIVARLSNDSMPVSYFNVRLTDLRIKGLNIGDNPRHSKYYAQIFHPRGSPCIELRIRKN